MLDHGYRSVVRPETLHFRVERLPKTRSTIQMRNTRVMKRTIMSPIFEVQPGLILKKIESQITMALRR